MEGPGHHVGVPSMEAAGRTLTHIEETAGGDFPGSKILLVGIVEHMYGLLGTTNILRTK